MKRYYSITSLGGNDLPFPQELWIEPDYLLRAIAHCETCIADGEEYLSKAAVACDAKYRGNNIAVLEIGGAWQSAPEPPFEAKPAQMGCDAMPLISVVIPSFNQARYVRQALDSVFSQNYPHLEVIVLDPGSTDGTREILLEYQDRIEQLIFEPDRGQSDALERGLNLARGDILTWLCTDDMLNPRSLVCAAAAFMRHGCDMVVGACQRIDEHGTVFGKHYASMPFDQVVSMNWSGMMEMLNKWGGGYFFYQPEVFFTKDIWRRAGGFFHQSAYYAMDYDLWVRMALAGARGVLIPPTLGCSRLQPEQKTGSGQEYLWQMLNFLKLYRREMLTAVQTCPEARGKTPREAAQKMNASEGKRLNLGCGARWRTGWVNIDFTSDSKHILQHDMLKGLPCDDDSCAAVYHAHLIERLSRKDTRSFLSECYRVLRPGGIIRVAFPDLGKMARDYVRLLDELQGGNKTVADDYEWVLLTMLDQMTRNVPGGQVAEYFMKEHVANDQFTAKYTGKSFSDTLRRTGRQAFLSGQQSEYEALESLPHQVKMMKIGKFRLSRENRQWVYDAYSLTELLSQIGFSDIAIQDAFTSRIPGWTDCNLDTEPDGSIFRPESAYIEASKNYA